MTRCSLRGIATVSLSPLASLLCAARIFSGTNCHVRGINKRESTYCRPAKKFRADRADVKNLIQTQRKEEKRGEEEKKKDRRKETEIEKRNREEHRKRKETSRQRECVIVVAVIFASQQRAVVYRPQENGGGVAAKSTSRLSSRSQVRLRHVALVNAAVAH